MTKRFDVITFGESMALFTPLREQSLEYSDTLNRSFGGAESNVAIGLARLGVRVSWFGHLGDDPQGRYILKRIRGEAVDVSRAKLVSSANTGLMMRHKVAGLEEVFYYRKHSAASRMSPEDLDEAFIADASILHITGITPALSDSCRATVERAVDMAKRHGVKVSLDPNLRLKLWTIEQAREVLLPLAAKADYFLPGMDELKRLYGTDDEEKALQEVKRLSALTVVKSVGNTNVIVRDGQTVAVPFEKIEHVVDTVGAGDAFAAGFLTGIVKGYTPEQAVRMGNLAAGFVIQGHGDWELVPTWQQLQQAMHNESVIER
jgi:2-dehydro-3-deoxygluconokinase